jgi:hypothetical protein
MRFHALLVATLGLVLHFGVSTAHASISGVTGPTTPPTQKPTSDDDEIIRVETDLIQVPFRVLDRIGNSVPGLKQADFGVCFFPEDLSPEERELREKLAQAGKRCAVNPNHPDRLPIESFTQGTTSFTGIVDLDVSPSVATHLEKVMKPAVERFLSFGGGSPDRLMREDQIQVLSFASNITKLFPSFVPGDQAQAEFRQAVARLRDNDGTSLWTSLRDTEALLRTEAASKHKIVLLITDGEDTTSGALKYEQIRDLYVESGIAVYFVQVGNSLDAGMSMQLASKTGGRYFAIDSADDLAKLSDAFTQILGDIRAKYMITFYSPDGAPKNVRHRFEIVQNGAPSRRAIEAVKTFCFGQACPAPVDNRLRVKTPGSSS